MSENVKIVPASCTQCGGTVEVDPGTDKAVCPFCGTTFIVEKAINNYTVEHATIEHADNVNIDMTGSVKSVLDFVGEQMKEGRAERRQARKEAAEQSRMMNNAFIKLMGIMFAFVFLFGVIMFIYYMIFGDNESADTAIDDHTYIEDSRFLSGTVSNDMISGLKDIYFVDV